MITEQQKKIYNTHSNGGITFDDFVKKINEICFNLEPEEYDEKHPEIKKAESERWENLAKEYFIKEPPLKVLDIGCGTGFVAEHVCKNLKQKDTFVFADISKEMIDYCQKKFGGKFVCKLEFEKADSDSLNFPGGSFDFITMNSALHHIPNTEKIMKESSRLLKNGGHLIIAHEVNSAFFKNKILWTNYKILRIFSDINLFIESLFKHLGMINFYKKHLYKEKIGLYDFDEVNKALIEQKIIYRPLSPSKIGLIIDLYSSIGFDIQELAGYAPDLFLVEKKTYNHLNLISMNWLLKIYDKILSFLFPNSGKSFVSVFQKISKQI